MNRIGAIGGLFAPISREGALILNNLFLASVVAVKEDTGEYVWHYQVTPQDQWDFTATQHMILADIKIDGSVRKVIMQAPKNGFFYVIDRETGKFISAKPYVGLNWATGVDPKTGRSIWARGGLRFQRG